MSNLTSLIALIITAIAESCVLIYIRSHSSKKNALVSAFSLLGYCMSFWCISLVIQILVIHFFSESYAIYVDYLVYFCIAFLPVFMFFFADIYEKGTFTFKVQYFALFIIPCITMVILFTNDYHHLFYERYAIRNVDAGFGAYFYIHSCYTYGLLLYDIFKIIRTSIKTTTYKSKQTLLIFLGVLFPLSVNVLGTTNIIPMSIYLTPISFSITIVLWGIAILRYNFLIVAPVALKIIVSQMSDAYIVLNKDYNVSDCNTSFETIFNITKKDIIGKDFYELDFGDKVVLENKNFGSYLEKVQKSNKTYKLNARLKDEAKYFTVEISGIMSDKQCIGVLIFLKDTTQHILDMEALKNNQNILMERERLATLGQMVGGIAHNLKTPIMSIAGAMEGLKDLVTEYDQSIDDPDVTKDDHHAIAHDMTEWISKVNSYDTYMSDVISAIKGQAVNFNDSSSNAFTIDDLLKRVNILMRHELKNALIVLDVVCDVDKSMVLNGNVNSLVQVVNNLISNAIQSYNGSQNEEILLTISEKNNNIVISVEDHGSGIPEDVQKKLFNEMVTTKGHKGTGLGLFMSYSTIKGQFNGELSFTSKVNEGTKFFISLPLQKIINEG